MGEQTTPDDYDPSKVVATAKHFLGDGGTNQGIDRGDTMASFNNWNGERLHGHKYLITDVLKGRMGFDGLVSVIGRTPARYRL